jgi:predicted Abi (CAAX) family protease
MPPVVPDGEGHANSEPAGIERSPLNAEGWYVYGALDDRGLFLIQSLAPRSLLRARARRPLENARDSRRYADKQSWRDLVAAKGDIIAAGSAPWSAGDRGLLAHTYGGIGGTKPEGSVVGPFYFGHFAYGLAEAVDDPLSGELRFEITYYQVYTQNTDGLIAGKLHWSRYLADRQFGWAGIRPVCDAILRLDAFAGPFDVGEDRRASALDAFMLQLEVMTARYRIGDGTGGTFVSAAHNCSQDSNRALFATLRAIDAFIKTHPSRERWRLEHPDQVDRYNALVKLLHDLRKKLQPFGAPRKDWSQNQYNLGGTAEDAPIQNVTTALGSWRSLLPRLAFNTVVDAFLRHDATIWVIGTCQIGGERPDIEPVVPFTI